MKSGEVCHICCLKIWVQHCWFLMVNHRWNSDQLFWCYLLYIWFYKLSIIRFRTSKYDGLPIPKSFQNLWCLVAWPRSKPFECVSFTVWALVVHTLGLPPRPPDLLYMGCMLKWSISSWTSLLCFGRIWRWISTEPGTINVGVWFAVAATIWWPVRRWEDSERFETNLLHQMAMKDRWKPISMCELGQPTNNV